MLWKTLVAHILPWFLVPLILLLVFSDDTLQAMVIIGAYFVLFINYFAMAHKRRIPLAFLGVTFAALVGYFWL